MPAYPEPGRLKAEIVARVAAGETVAAICASPGMACEGMARGGMPGAGSVQVWRRRDAGFAAALAEARVRRAARRSPYPFDAAVAAAFMARVAGGEPIRDLLARPGMPSQAAYRYWRRTDGEFAEAMWRLRAARYERRTGRLHGRWRAWDEAVADRITLAVMRGAVMRRFLGTDAALPSLAVVARWRREHCEWDAALRWAMKTGRRVRERGWSLAQLTPELRDEIGDRIATGGSLRSLGADAAIPCAATLYRWVALSPEFAGEVARACDLRADLYSDMMIDICERNGPLRLAATRREARPLQWRVNQLAKRPGWKRRRAAREALSAEREAGGV